ncbi:hypothetical protein [Neoroseomonas soli]|uniref:Uncharacterized protein n=1 Tax=Neoroseomonas soli TaxID=1081025 RepID=A0A9X9WSY9_9PROT|nr:hypothetical protein [Neoroseomonas soli]MBR0670268.1 hypothetical protein [Neoroseomonas soli]
MSGAASIELRLSTAAQLFNTLDPAPFREGDLAPDAEQYILDWVEDLPAHAPLAILVHLPAAEAATPAAASIPDSLRAFFAHRADAAARQIRENFRSGRHALVIGLAILSACLALAVTLAPEGEAIGAARIAQESLVILGWVALWRPAEIFLYDWLPIARRRARFRRLAGATLTVLGDTPVQPMRRQPS